MESSPNKKNDEEVKAEILKLFLGVMRRRLNTAGYL